MGNQGMTNWKFSMFLVIALTLVAGLFADTALAAKGAGKMTVAVTSDGANDADRLADLTNDPDDVWKAGGKVDAVFTFTADDPTTGPIYMNGAMVKLKIPGDWKFGLDSIMSIKDGETDQLYLKGARLTEDAALASYKADNSVVDLAVYNTISRIRGPALKAHRDKRRIDLEINGDGHVTEIVVELDGTAWTADREPGRELTITLGVPGAEEAHRYSTTHPHRAISVPIPAKLTYDANDFPYMTYDFETYTAAATSPKAYGIAGSDSEPEIRVGNIDQDDAVKVTQINPDIYTGDKPVNFKIKILANGPIYDIDAEGNVLNAQVKVNLSLVATAFKELLKPKNYSDKITVTDETPNPDVDVDFYLPVLNNYHLGLLTGSATHTGDVTVAAAPSTAVGYVKASLSDGTSLVATVTSGVVTIDVDSVDKDQYIELTVNEVLPATPTDDIAVVTVKSDLDHATNFSTATATTKAGEVKARAGGKFEVSYEVAKADDETGDTDITYTAETQLQGAYLYVRLPESGSGENTVAAFVKPDGTTPLVYTVEKGQPGEVEKLQNQGRGQDVAQAEILESGKFIRWGPIYPNKGDIFKWRIKGVEITGTTGTYTWDAFVRLGTYSLHSGNLRVTAPTSGNNLVTNEPVAGTTPNQLLKLYVVEADANTTSPDVTFKISAATALPLSTLGAAAAKTIRTTGGFKSYDAAGRYRITFEVHLLRTPFKNGEVWFTLPDGWSAPHKKTSTDPHKPPAPGYTTKSIAEGKLTFPTSRQIKVSELTLAKDSKFTITYGALQDPADGVGDNMVGAFVQPDAGDETITSDFDVDGSGRVASQASNTLSVRVENVAAGSGHATIKPVKVEAGSLTDLAVEFEALGTMDGGRVTLQMPENWGDLQNSDTKADNYVEATPSSVVDSLHTDDDTVTVNLATLGKSSRLTIKLKNVIVQPSTLGVAEFTIKSAGTKGESPTIVVGQIPPDDAYTNAGVDVLKLLGRVYQTVCIDDVEAGEGASVPDDYDGLLRVQVTGGGDGGGRVRPGDPEIRASENSGDYIDGDGVVETGIKQLHAGDGAKTHLRFIYTPIETIRNGELRFTVPDGWSPPQVTRSDLVGFTEISTRGTISGPSVSGRALTVPISRISRDNPITIDYGARGGAVMPPTTVGTETFTVEVKGTATGNFKAIPRQPKVYIRPQASGKGTATVEPDTVGTDSNVYAGDTGRTFTITYEAVGQVVNGDLKITVPDKWSTAMAAHFDIPSGSAVFGGDMTAEQRAADDPVDNNITNGDAGARELIVSGINLSAGGTYTVTYKDVKVQSTKGGVSFKVEFRGDGPGVAGKAPNQAYTFAAVGTPEGQADAQKVNVMDVKPGSGTVAVAGPDVITVGSAGNDITITYTAAAQISAGKKIQVAVPAGWSAPIAGDAAADKMGTYTVMHKKADGTAFTDRYGDVTDTADSIDEVAPSGRMMVASVTGDGVDEGEMVIFTYENATAPSTAGMSEFQVTFDGVVVESDTDTVIVQSAAGVSKLGLEASDADGNATDTFMIDDGGTLTVTVKLLATDDSVDSLATRAEATTVTLTSSSTTGTFTPATLTIAAGETMGMTAYADTMAGNVTINASTTATGVAAAEALAIKANTENPVITTVKFSPMYVRDGDAVTVTAMGTPFQTATFMIENINAAGGGGISMTDDGDGTYTGAFTLTNGSQEGMHSVTVTINGTSMAAPNKLTVDNTQPDVKVSTPTAGMMVVNGDTVNITATVTDATAVTVMADVSMLDSTAEADSVMLSDADADGTYEGMHTVSMANTMANGDYAITVKATDAAGNMGEEMVTVALDNTMSYTSMIPVGLSLFHVPLVAEGLTTVGDLKAEIGSGASFLIVYDHAKGRWTPDSDDVMITADLGIIVSMSAASEVTFEGHPWGTDGSAMISLTQGQNLIGLPLNDSSVTNISDIAGLFGAGVVTTIVAASGGNFQVASAGSAGDGPVAGDAAYLVIASADGTATVTGPGWGNGGSTSAAPIALSGYTVDDQTPVLDVQGSVVDEITGLAKEGFRVKVKNLSTKAALSDVTAVEEASDGYNMTFVDLNDSHAARIGDVLEISADSPNPLIGVQSVRHIVTAEDVKNSRIELESLIAYEIPAETELLRNYPNPFNPETWIPYHLSEDADVKLTIYDINGGVVRDIDVGHQTAAKYATRSKAIYWDGRNRFGEQVASGIYFYSLSAGDFSATRKMVILK